MPSTSNVNEQSTHPSVPNIVRDENPRSVFERNGTCIPSRLHTSGPTEGTSQTSIESQELARKTIPYDPRLTQIARMLRNNMTLAEILLWNELKNKQLFGYDFHRQKPIDEFVVDFFCPKLLLAIEIDGGSHEGKLERDSQRQRDIEKFGVKFLRFSDQEVKHNLEGVIDAIADWIQTQRPSHTEHLGDDTQELSVPSHAQGRGLREGRWAV